MLKSVAGYAVYICRPPTSFLDMAGNSDRSHTRLFRSNRAQAVRLPKDVAFPPGVKDVTILREGNRRILVPSDASWGDFFAAPSIELVRRDQPELPAREPF